MSARTRIIFEGDDSKLSEVLGGIDKKLLSFQTKVTAAFAAFKGVEKVFDGIRSLGEQVDAQFEKGSALKALRDQTGLAIDQIMMLQHQFRAANVDAELMGGTINKMQKALAEGTSDDLLKKIGLDPTKLRKASPEAQFAAIGKAINNLSDPASRAAAAISIFGKSGGELLSVFSSSDFGKVPSNIANSAKIMSRDADLFDAVSTKLEEAGKRTSSFFLGVADRVGPVLIPILDKINSIDMAKLGQAVGDHLATLTTMITDGSWKDAFSDILAIMAGKVLGFITGVFAAIGIGIGATLDAILSTIITPFEMLTKPDFWKGFGLTFLSYAQGFIALLLDGVTWMLQKLSVIPHYGKRFAEAAQSTAKLAHQYHVDAGSNFSQTGDRLIPVLSHGADDITASWKNVGTKIAAYYKMGAQVFDTSSIEKDLQKTLVPEYLKTDKAGNEERAKIQPTARANGNKIDLTASAATSASKSSSIFASSLAKIAGGGGAYQSHPLITAQQNNTDALKKHTDALKNNTKQLEHVGHKGIVAHWG